MWSTNFPTEKLTNSAPVTMRIAVVTYAGAPRKRDPVSQSMAPLTVTFMARSRPFSVLPQEPLDLVGEVVGRRQVLLLRDRGRVAEDHALALRVLGVDAG